MLKLFGEFGLLEAPEPAPVAVEPEQPTPESAVEAAPAEPAPQVAHPPRRSWRDQRRQEALAAHLVDEEHELVVKQEQLAALAAELEERERELLAEQDRLNALALRLVEEEMDMDAERRRRAGLAAAPTRPEPVRPLVSVPDVVPHAPTPVAPTPVAPIETRSEPVVVAARHDTVILALEDGRQIRIIASERDGWEGFESRYETLLTGHPDGPDRIYWTPVELYRPRYGATYEECLEAAVVEVSRGPTFEPVLEDNPKPRRRGFGFRRRGR